ncbi:NlpC/P60 family protein, partial [Helicobacter cinaedi]
RNYTTHTKLDYKPPLSLQFNGKELQILEWGEVKRDKLDSNIFDKGNNENKAYYRIYSKDYDVIDKQDIPKLFSSYSLTYDILDTEKYYQSNHLKEQDIIVSMKQDTSLPKGSYYLYTKDIEQSLKIQTDYLYRARGYKALNIYTIDTNNQYKISYHSNPLDNIPYPKGTTFIIAPNTPIPTHYTDKKVKICLKGSRTYKDFILNLKQKIDTLKTQGYEIDKVKLEVGYESELLWIAIAKKELGVLEIKGNIHNPRIIEYHSTTGKFKDDETAWCSSFVNWVMTQAGIKGTNSAAARSWKDWGQKLDKPAYGCIGVHIKPNGYGHVGFIVGKTENGYLVSLGGNQNDSVKHTAYSKNFFQYFVYPKEYVPNYTLPTLNSNTINKGEKTR